MIKKTAARFTLAAVPVIAAVALLGEPILDNEHDTVHGPALLRVTGQIKPSHAAAYATAFTS